jgi:hypothetical protein
MNYSISIEWPATDPGDPEDANVDVMVTFGDGSRYWATFFTVRNVSSLMARWRVSGEYGGGNYFWAIHAILVDRLEEATIRMAIANLLEEKDFHSAFGRLENP